jgi:hypothetical protein
VIAGHGRAIALPLRLLQGVDVAGDAAVNRHWAAAIQVALTTATFTLEMRRQRIKLFSAYKAPDDLSVVMRHTWIQPLKPGSARLMIESMLEFDWKRIDGNIIRPRLTMKRSFWVSTSAIGLSQRLRILRPHFFIERALR